LGAKAVHVTPTVLGLGNSTVYLGWNLGPEGEGQEYAVKEVQLADVDKRINMRGLLSLQAELLMMAQLSSRAPDAPICYPVGHGRCIVRSSANFFPLPICSLLILLQRFKIQALETTVFASISLV